MYGPTLKGEDAMSRAGHAETVEQGVPPTESPLSRTGSTRVGGSHTWPVYLQPVDRLYRHDTFPSNDQERPRDSSGPSGRDPLGQLRRQVGYNQTRRVVQARENVELSELQRDLEAQFGWWPEDAALNGLEKRRRVQFWRVTRDGLVPLPGGLRVKQHQTFTWFPGVHPEEFAVYTVEDEQPLQVEGLDLTTVPAGEDGYELCLERVGNFVENGNPSGQQHESVPHTLTVGLATRFAYVQRDIRAALNIGEENLVINFRNQQGEVFEGIRDQTLGEVGITNLATHRGNLSFYTGRRPQGSLFRDQPGSLAGEPNAEYGADIHWLVVGNHPPEAGRQHTG